MSTPLSKIQVGDRVNANERYERDCVGNVVARHSFGDHEVVVVEVGRQRRLTDNGAIRTCMSEAGFVTVTSFEKSALRVVGTVTQPKEP